MLSLIVLGLVVCESASSFEFNKVTENYDRVINYPNILPSNNYDYNLVILHEQKKNISMKKHNLDINIENIDMQKEDLHREIEKIDWKKEYLDREIEKLNRQKDNLDRETDIIYRKIDNLDRSIDYLNIQKDKLDNEIQKVDLEIEEHNTDNDRNIYKVQNESVEDNEYRITINLPGYNENEIVVKSGRGRLVVQALHDVLGEPKRSFQKIRTLPYFVTENGSWSYKWGMLMIVFPAIQRTRYEPHNVVYQNGVIGKDDLERKYTISSTDKAKVPTTYVSSYDVQKTTQVTSRGDDIVTNIDSKNKKGEPTTYSFSKNNKIETITNLNPIYKRGDVETTVSVLKPDDDLKINTPTFGPNQDDDV